MHNGRTAAPLRSVPAVTGSGLVAAGQSAGSPAAVSATEGALVVAIGLSPAQAARVLELADDGTTVLVARDMDRALQLLGSKGRSTPARADLQSLEVDRTGRQVRLSGRPLPLSAREFDLLAQLAGEPGRVWTFEALTEQVWRRPYLGDDESVVSAVKRLRRRLVDADADVKIASVRGVGYRLVTDAG